MAPIQLHAARGAAMSRRRAAARSCFASSCRAATAARSALLRHVTYIRVPRARRHISNGLAWTCSAVSDWPALAFGMEQPHAP